MEHNSNSNRYAQTPPPPLSYPPRFSSDNRNFYHHQFPPPPPPPPPFHHPPRFPYFSHMEDEPTRRHAFDVQHSPRVSSSSSDHHHHHYNRHHHNIPTATIFDQHHQFRQSEDDFPHFYPEEEVHRDVWMKPSRLPNNWDHDPRHRVNHSISPHRNRHRDSASDSYYFVDQNRFAEHPQEEKGRKFQDYYSSRRDGYNRNQKEEYFWNQDDCRPNTSSHDHDGNGNVNYRRRYNLGNNQGKERVLDDVEDRRRLKHSARLSSIIREVVDDPSVDKSAVERENQEKKDLDIQVNDERVFIRKQRFSHQQQQQQKNGKFKRMADGGDNSIEFFHTPIKKRTSALLRVQSAKKSTPRKRRGGEDSLVQHFNDTNSGPSRCRGPLVFSDDKPPGEDGQGTAVEELDVSFKSNSLVAKTKTLPSNSSGSPVNNEIHEGLLKGDSSRIHSDLALRSNKSLTTSKDAVIDAETGPVDNNGLQPCTDGISPSFDCGGVVRSLSSTIVGSDGICKPEIKMKKKKKKKKKKMKVAAPNLCLLSSRVTEVHERAVKTDILMSGVDATASVGLTQSEEKFKDADIGSDGFQSSLNGNNAPLKNMDIIESAHCPVDGSDVMCTAKVKMTRSMMVPLPTLSSSRKTEIHDRFINADSSEKEKVAASVVGSVDDINLQPLHWFTVSLENSQGVQSPPSCVVGSDDTPKTKKKRRLVDRLSGFPKSMVTESHAEHVNAVSSTHGADFASSSEKNLTHSEEKVIASGIENCGEVGSLPNHITRSDNTTKTKKRRRSVDPLSVLSRSMLTESHDEPVNAFSSIHGADASSSFDKSLAHAEENVTFSGIGNVDDGGSQPLLMVTSSCENHVVEQSSLNPPVCYDGEHTPILKKLNKQRSLNLGLASSWVTETVEEAENADICRRGASASSSSYKAPMQPEEKAMVSDIGSVFDVDSQPLNRSSERLKNMGEVGFSLVTEEDVRNFTPPNMYSDLFVESSVLNLHSSSSELESRQQDVIPVVTVSNCQQYPLQKDIIELDTVGEGEGQTEGRSLFSRVTCESITLQSQSQENVRISPLRFESSGLDERVLCKALEDDSNDALDKDELLSMPNNVSPGAEYSSLSITNSNEGINSTYDKQPNIDSEESMSPVPELQTLNSNSRQDEKLKAVDGVFLKGNDSSTSDPDLKMTLDEALQDDHLVSERTLLLQSGDTKQPAPTPNLTGGESTRRKFNSSMPKVLPVRATLGSGSLKQSLSSTPVARHKTWYRTDTISSVPHPTSCLIAAPSQSRSQKQCGKIQSTSYIRKGNSLLRKSSPVASLPQEFHGLSNSVYRLNSAGRNETRKGSVSEGKVNGTKPQIGLKTGFERVTAPTLPHQSKSSNCTTKSSQDLASSKSTISLLEGASETSIHSTKMSESKDAPKQAGPSENQVGVNINLGTQSTVNNGKSKKITTKKTIYVKHKLNQLVAARHPEIRDPSSSVPEKQQAVANSISDDQYYKRNKNQLIRNVPLVQSHLKPAVAVPEKSLPSEGQRTKVSSLKFGRNMSRQRPEKYLFPWKRMIYWRKNIAIGSNRSSSSLVSRKLLLSRNRDTVYTRSTGGFSLRRSKVLSIGGSNLKWSKSIEKRSKKANEEATLAVAAVEKKKREQKGAAYAVARAKSRNQSSRKSAHSVELHSGRPINIPGERIFRIGSVRYRMDSSRRTLQRIPDEKSASSLDQRSGKNTKMSFIPKRLLIGNNEYVRIGNGNQLVRDPKTRIRILASEKVRWSLHTARLRLVRKRQYCQFFTRFGKCSKDGGKCPYIHDPAKIAVCTKFLNGLCSNTNCKLTHKVIPERMQDCSYFLQGLCTNENCPYRHVNVNPNASVCEGFLRGYCADGNECHKKHSYVCPQFESTGECPQGTKCKLHHPTTLNTKSRKRKRSKENTKKIRGRYFGSNRFNGESETGKTASGTHTEQKKNEGSFCHEGMLRDYVSLDVSESDSEEEAQETTNEAKMDKKRNLCCDGHPSLDLLLLQSDDLDDDDDNDELSIKPVAIMNIKKQTQT